MGTRTEKALTEVDVCRYVSERSDFSFELKVLQKFLELGFTCEHGGTYNDPISEKGRQFDIRGIRTFKNIRVVIAVECKNIGKNSPLIAHCVPRKEHEAYNCIARAKFNLDDGRPDRVHGESLIEKRTGQGSIYARNLPVCKFLAQAWEERIKEEGVTKEIITGKDNEIYERWSQAISSCSDLIYKETNFYASDPNVEAEAYSIVIPMLMVPCETLWHTQFDESGSWSGKVELGNHVSIYIDKDIPSGL